MGQGSITVTGSGTPVTAPYIVTFDIEEELGGIATDATACAVLNDPKVPVLLGDGSVVMVDLPCPDYTNIALPGNAFAFTYSGTTTDADPGDGFVRLNNGTISSVTSIYVSDQEILGTDITDWLDSLDNATGSPKGRIRVYSRQDPTNWADFTLTSVTTATGYRKLVVTYNDHNGTFSNDVGDTVIDFSMGGVLSTVLILNVGDESTTITTGTNKYVFRMPYAMTLTEVRSSINTVSSSGLPTVDINKNTSTILSTKLTIDVSEKTSTTAATPAVISDPSLADDDEIEIDIDTAGTGAKGLKVYLIGYRT